MIKMKYYEAITLNRVLVEDEDIIKATKTENKAVITFMGLENKSLELSLSKKSFLQLYEKMKLIKSRGFR